MTAPRRIKVTAPVVRRDGPTEEVGLLIGGRVFRLVGDGDDRAVRSLAAALHMAKSVTLVIDQHEAFPAPEDKS